METFLVFTEHIELVDFAGLLAPLGKPEFLPYGAAASMGERDVALAFIACGGDETEGLNLLQGLKRNRPDVPVIFVTGASSEALVMAAFKLGARDYFTIPFDPAEFRETVEKILRYRRGRDGTPGADKEERAGEPQGDAEIPERLHRAIGYIERNLGTALYLDEIASHACLSKYHFCRLFKKHVGVSPIQFVLNLRISRAKVLLSRPELTIASVAVRTGFSDLSEFNKKFKKVTGITPTEYRKKG